MHRPLVGITAYLEAARWGAWVREAVISPQAYARAVEKAGGTPVIVPPLRPGAAADYVHGLDALILAGGVELDPALYGADRDDRLDAPQPQRDRFELALAKSAIESDLPVLGVSRGMHVLNVAHGGTLIPWLPDTVAHDRHKEPKHHLQVSVSSRVGKAIGDRAEVTGPHNQSVRTLGTGFIAVAWADDQIVEAIELPSHRFAVGIQWHPERTPDPRLFESLIDAARP